MPIFLTDISRAVSFKRDLRAIFPNPFARFAAFDLYKSLCSLRTNPDHRLRGTGIRMRQRMMYDVLFVRMAL